MSRTSGSVSKPPCRPVEHDCVGRKGYQTLQAIVDDYDRFHAPVARAEMEFYKGLPLTEAIERAARAERPDGKRHDHQRRIRKEALRKVQVVLRQATLPDGREFRLLYESLAAITRKTKGIGPLFVYDAALRIGASRRAHPKFVYIHAGVRKAARAVLVRGVSAVVPRDRFPPPLSRRSASEIQDILCTFAKALGQMKKD